MAAVYTAYSEPTILLVIREICNWIVTETQGALCGVKGHAAVIALWRRVWESGQLDGWVAVKLQIKHTSL